MLSVVIPRKAEEARTQLNIEKLSIKEIFNKNKFDNIVVKKGATLFERIK